MSEKLSSRKTILVGTIAAAFILGMVIMSPQQLQAQDQDEEEQQKQITSSKSFPVEVLSTEVVEEYESNGTPVQLQKQTVRFIEKPTYEDIVALNQDHFDFLIAELGEEGESIVEQKKQEIRESVEKIPDELEVDVVKTGGHSITYSHHLYEVNWLGQPGNVKDPVNVVFYNNGQVVDVDTALRTKTPYTWPYASGWSQFAYIDDTSHGGSAYWKTQDFQHEYGNYWTERYHIRTFDGGLDTHGTYDYWTLAGVHYEECCHTVLSWEDAEEFVVEDNFRGQSFVGTVGYVYIANNQYYQGVWNDGWAGYIELQ